MVLADDGVATRDGGLQHPCSLGGRRGACRWARCARLAGRPAVRRSRRQDDDGELAADLGLVALVVEDVLDEVTPEVTHALLL